MVAKSLDADLLVLAGDTFDSHRLPDDFVAHAAALISTAGLPIVLQAIMTPSSSIRCMRIKRSAVPATFTSLV